MTLTVLLLLLLSCALAVLAARERLAWLRVVIIGVALAGIWQYVTAERHRSALAQATMRRLSAMAARRHTLQVGMAPSLQGGPQEVSITYTIPCAGVVKRARTELCGREGRFSDSLLTAGTQAELRARFSQAISLQVWSPQQPLRGAVEPLRYASRHDEVTELVLTPNATLDQVMITRRTTGMVLVGQTAAILPLVPVASAEVCVTLGAPGCAGARCIVTAVRIGAHGRYFCADEFAARALDSFAARLRPC